MNDLFIFLIVLITIIGRMMLIVMMKENKTLIAIFGSSVIICLSAVGAFPIDPERHTHTGETHRYFNLRNFRKNIFGLRKSLKHIFFNVEMFYGCTTEPCVHEITTKWNSDLQRIDNFPR